MDKSHVVIGEIVSGFSVLTSVFNNILVLAKLHNVVRIIEYGELNDQGRPVLRESK